MEDEKNKVNNKKHLKDENLNAENDATKKDFTKNNTEIFNKNKDENIIKKSKCKFYRIFYFQMIICLFILIFLLIIRIIPDTNCLVIKQNVKTAIEGKNFENFFYDIQSYFKKNINNFGFHTKEKDEENKNNKNDKDNKTVETDLNNNNQPLKEKIVNDYRDVVVANEDEIFKLYSIHDEDDLTCFNFKKPIKGEIASRYGLRENPFLKGKSDFHNGVDISAREGTPVVAIADGIVKLATKSNVSGNYILIKHGDVYESLYAHCSKLLVSNGNTVKKGDKIALSGHTGKVTGAHLHLGIKKHGNWIDPMEVFPNFL